MPICIECRHLNPDNRGPMRCAAFPKEIPEAILLAQADHHKPYPGDHGIRFEPIAPATKP
jgi:hypothetical protein